MLRVALVVSGHEAREQELLDIFFALRFTDKIINIASLRFTLLIRPGLPECPVARAM